MTANNDLLTCITGDPFADTGADVLNYLFEIYPDQDLNQLIEFITDIYVNQFNCNLYVYFLNHPITNGRIDKQTKKFMTVKYYTDLVNDNEKSGKIGICCLTGKSGIVFKQTRANSILTGVSNFTPSLSGSYVCGEILIRLYFAPLGMIKFRDKSIVMRSNVQQVNNLFIKENCDHNLDCNMTELRSVQLSFYENYIFNFIDKAIKYVEDDLSLCQLNFFKFTNFAQDPDINITTIDSNLLDFYKSMRDNILWNKFITDHDKEKKVGTNIYTYNEILCNLINRKSILPIIREYSINNKLDMNIFQKFIYC